MNVLTVQWATFHACLLCCLLETIRGLVGPFSEREGWETVYSTFSPTVAFSDIRLLISLTVDPKYSVESYDLSGAFLGTELRDRSVYIRLPRDAGIHVEVEYITLADMICEVKYLRELARGLGFAQ